VTSVFLPNKPRPNVRVGSLPFRGSRW